MKKYLFYTSMVTLMLVSGCQNGGESIYPSATGPISLSDLEVGNASGSISGDENFVFNGRVIGQNNATATYDDKLYRLHLIRVVNADLLDNRGFYFVFHVPADQPSNFPPIGDIPIAPADAALDETYVTTFIDSETTRFSATSAVIGSVTISESSSERLFSFDMEFSIENLTSDNGKSVSLNGALKY
ncbi:MAG: hypothetical protein AAFO69_01620 [Bacteroidota bacterium]